ncbi:ParB/RepB/Spo0J family partition protein [Faecalibaculum rodentium]|uniref:ParB/RepB/Spo0J family partition protein n=1 Tax=Faecalibaculum rodentium TaxID=1702221 RepID=UPI0023EF581A|nr:ParB N-terminal domain-containing protein [Faecalibaculum rodentium]
MATSALRELMRNDDRKVIKIPLDEIHHYSGNFYQDTNPEGFQRKAESIALNIEREGLIHPIEVMKDGQGEYTILSGNTRYKAVSLLFERGIGDGTIEALVHERMDENAALHRVVSANIQREKTSEEVLMEISILGDEYEQLHREHKITGRKDEYIAAKLGISQRTIRNYRKKDMETKAKQASAVGQDTTSSRKSEKPRKPRKLSRKAAVNHLCKHAEKMLPITIKEVTIAESQSIDPEVADHFNQLIHHYAEILSILSKEKREENENESLHDQ